MSTPANDLNITTAGYVVFDGVATFQGRTLQAGPDITVSYGDGIYGNTTIGLNNAITLGDLSAIAANSNALSATTGDINIDAGNLKLPATNAALTQGVASISTTRYHIFGTDNIFLGVTAGNGTLTGADNIAIGLNGLSLLSSGAMNVSVGANANRRVSTGSNNCAFGVATLTNVTTSSNQTAYGHNAGNLVATGSGGNTFIGFQSFNVLATGAFNTGCGGNTGTSYTGAESQNICIGYSVTGTLGESNVTRIGASQSACYIDGIDGVNVGSVAKVVTMASDQLGTATLTAGTGVTITPGANTITINAAGGGLTWSVVTVDASFTANTGTIANKAGLLTMTLPASGAIGDIIRITGINTALGWKIAQNANQQIFIGTSSTSVGAGGSIASINIRDSLEMVCVVAGASTVWNVLSSEGNFTIV